jgi:hypothetical protein
MTEREQFEANMRASPFEWDAYQLRRYPNDAAKYGWPDNYVEYHVQLAWDVWQDARETK